MINRNPHDPTDNCAQHHCHWHHTDEPITPGQGTTCGECFHYFPTGLHLWIDHQRVVLRYSLTDLRQAHTDRAARSTRTTMRLAPGATPPANHYPQPILDAVNTTVPADDFNRLLTEINQPLQPIPPLTYGRIVRNIIRHLTTPPRNINTCPHCTHGL